MMFLRNDSKDDLERLRCGTEDKSARERSHMTTTACSTIGGMGTVEEWIGCEDDSLIPEELR